MKHTLSAIAVLLTLSANTLYAENYPPVEKQHFEVITATNVNFEFDLDDFTNEEISKAKEVVENVAVYLESYPDTYVRIEGHTDETGTETYNMGLASRRIKEVSDMLVAEGIDSSRIIRVPYGEVNSLADGHSDAAWLANRRINISIVKHTTGQ